jgi:hypothetical protein
LHCFVGEDGPPSRIERFVERVTSKERLIEPAAKCYGCDFVDTFLAFDGHDVINTDREDRRGDTL